MTTRSLSIAATAAGLLVAASLLPHQAAALPGLAETQAGPSLVQQVGSKYNRRYYRDNGTYVRAPFTEVDTRRGTWVASAKSSADAAWPGSCPNHTAARNAYSAVFGNMRRSFQANYTP